MAEVIRMPRLSDTMEEGVIIGWSKKVGDTVSPGDVLAEVETDKATMDLESFHGGTLLHIEVEKGEVPVDGIIAIIGDKDENVADILAAEKSPGSKQSTNTPAVEPSEGVQEEVSSSATQDQAAQPISAPVQEADQRIKASPLAKKMAQDAGISLAGVKGTGEEGRIVRRDVESAIESVSKAGSNAGQTTAPSLGYKDIPVSQMRKTIAKRLGESKFGAPHFYLTMDIDMTETMSARKSINEMIAPEKVSVNDLVVKACAAALKKHPEVNASWLGDKIRQHYDVHIGVAVAVDEGLVVPVINNTDQKSLTTISAEIADKASRARNKKLGLDEMQGNTFSISNLGMFGISEFTAIINPPDACILAVGGINRVPVVSEQDEIVIRSMMKVTLSCDHRVVDGAMGAQFLKTLKLLLENPVRILA